MNLETVIHTLQGTLDGVFEVRRAAETQLAQLETIAGYFSILLQIITIETIPLELKQASILRLKNIVKQYWTIKEGVAQRISDQDRTVIKDHLFEAIIWQQIPSLKVQLLECMLCVARADFPDKWPALLPSILKNFEAQDAKRVYGATCALVILFKKYQFKKDRSFIVEATMPILIQLFQAILTQTTQGAFDLMRAITKIVFMATQLSVPPFMKQREVMGTWISAFIQLQTIILPPSTNTASLSPEEEKEGKEKSALWKAKKWACMFFDRMFNRFGRPKYVDTDTKPFATMYFQTFVPLTLNCFLGILQARERGEYVSPRVLQLAYNFIDTSVSFSVLYKQQIKPHRHFILLKSIFPTLCLTPDDLRLWYSDPHDYVRKSADVMEEFYDPRVAATNVLIRLVQVRTRDCLDMVLGAVVQIMNFYAAQTDTQQKNVIHKEAALRMIGSLNSLLLKSEEYHKPIESLILTHVFPEFQNPTGFMRSRAAWVIGQFSRLPFSNKQQKATSVQLIINALQDKELPVKMEASKALSRIVRDEEVMEFIKPMVPALLDQFFHIMDEIGNEEVVVTLENLIKHVGSEIAPHATQVSQRLVTFFLRLSAADEEDEEAALTALQCIRAINTILNSVSALPDLYLSLEPICQPVMNAMLTEQGMEFFEETLEMITCFTYYPHQISPYMWTCLVQLVHAYHNWAVDYIRDMLAPIDNFISKGNEIFCSSKNPNYLDLVLSMVTKVYTDANMKTEAKHTNKIMETILAHCRGKVDHVIPAIIQLVSNKLFTEKDLQFKFLCCDVLGGAAYYNPRLFLSIIAGMGNEFEKNLFNHWLSHLEEMKGCPKHQKMSALGLSSLALVDLSATRDLQAAFPQVLEQLVLMLQNLNEETGDEGDDEDEEESEDDEGILDVDEEQDNEDEMEGVAEYTKSIQENLANILEGNVDAETFESPLDDVDPFVFFAQCLEQLSLQNVALYQQWVQALSPEKQATLTQLMNVAKEKKEKQEEAKMPAAVIHH